MAPRRATGPNAGGPATSLTRADSPHLRRAALTRRDSPAAESLRVLRVAPTVHVRAHTALSAPDARAVPFTHP